MMEEFFDDKNAKAGRCDGCKYCSSVYGSGGWQFYGCYHHPNRGAWVATIKDCPKEKEADGNG